MAHCNVDYSKLNYPTGFDRQILRFVHGVRGRRANPPTLKKITAWFGGTPHSFTVAAVDHLVDRGYLTVLRSGTRARNCAYVYDITNMGAAYMYGDTVWNTPTSREVYQGAR